MQRHISQPCLFLLRDDKGFTQELKRESMQEGDKKPQIRSFQCYAKLRSSRLSSLSDKRWDLVNEATASLASGNCSINLHARQIKGGCGWLTWMTGAPVRPLPDCTNTQREALCEIPNSSGEIERPREALGAPQGPLGGLNSEALELSDRLMKEPGLPVLLYPRRLPQPTAALISFSKHTEAALSRGSAVRGGWGGAQERQLRVDLLIVLRRSNDL